MITNVIITKVTSFNDQMQTSIPTISETAANALALGKNEIITSLARCTRGVRVFFQSKNGI